MTSICELHKKLLAALALAVMGLAMAALSGCSSTEEAPPPEESSGGAYDACLQQCASVPEKDQDECLILCEA